MVVNIVMMLLQNARARMLDKVDRSPLTIGHTYEEDWYVDLMITYKIDDNL